MNKSDANLEKSNRNATALLYFVFSLAMLAVVVMSFSRLMVGESDMRRFGGVFQELYRPEYRGRPGTVAGLIYIDDSSGESIVVSSQANRSVYGELSNGDRLKGMLAGKEITELWVNGEQKFGVDSYMWYGALGLLLGSIAFIVFGVLSVVTAETRLKPPQMSG